jgi:hypothetical protein
MSTTPIIRDSAAPPKGRTQLVEDGNSPNNTTAISRLFFSKKSNSPNALHTSTISSHNQTQLLLEEDNKLIPTTRKTRKAPQEESRLTISQDGAAQEIIKPQKVSNYGSNRSRWNYKLKVFLKSKLYVNLDTVMAVLYCMVILVLVFCDSYFVFSPTNTDVPNVIVAITKVALAFMCVYILDMILHVMGNGFSDCKSVWDIGAAVIRVSTWILLIVTVGAMLNNSNSSLQSVYPICRLFMVIFLARKVHEITKEKKYKIDVEDTDYASPLPKILEIMESVRPLIQDETKLAKYKWAMEMISSNKLYEPILDYLDKHSGRAGSESDIKGWVTKYALGLRDDVTPANVSPEQKEKDKDKRRPSLTVSVVNERRQSLTRPINIPNPVLEIFDRDLDDLAFNIFDIKKISGGEELQFILYYIFDKANLFTKLNINSTTFCALVNRLATGYLNNPYHCCTHAADVTQTAHYFMRKAGFADLAELTPLEQAAVYLGCAIHDFEHPGTNNTFHINTRSTYAVRYNDKSVLENHHISASSQILMEDKYNIFKSFSKEDNNRMRERLIAMVLATDMANHFADLAKIKGRLSSADFNPKDKDKNMCMELIVHASDISNPGKPYDVYKEWTFRILEEFWNQGDKERDAGLPITYLCDRYTVNTAKSQIGFIDFIVFPTFDILRQIIPKVDLSHFDANKAKWKEQIDYYDRELAALNDKKKELEKAKEVKADAVPLK